MIPFNFIRPKTLGEVLDFLAEKGEKAKIVAGGTDLLVELRGIPVGEKGPEWVVDISGLPELKGIREEGEIITVGSGVTHREVHTSDLIREGAPLLAAASATVGAAQHRNIATIGGNIMNASPAADTVPALIALEAEAVLKSREGERAGKLSEIFVKPYQTDASPGEILTAVRFRRLPAGAKSAFVKLGRRNALAISRMNVAVVLFLEDGTVREARIAPGSATPMPERFAEAEAVLLGRKPSEEILRSAGAAVAAEMVERSGRRWSTPYKEPVIAALTARALREALA